MLFLLEGMRKVVFCRSKMASVAISCVAATDIFNLQYALLDKYGLAAIEGVFLWNADFLG